MHLAYLALGGAGALAGGWMGYSLGVALAYYGMRVVAQRALTAQAHHH